MTYDHWKTTDPADRWINIDPRDEEEAEAPYYVEPRQRTYVVVDERDDREVQHFPYGRDWRVALQLAEALRDELNHVAPEAARKRSAAILAGFDKALNDLEAAIKAERQPPGRILDFDDVPF